MSIRRALTGCTLLAAVFVPSALADGLPVLGIDVGSTGVAAPAGTARYVTIPAPRGTMVERIQRAGGRVLSAVLVPGTFTIPAVAYDGSASGLAGDGHTLVLIEPRTSFPRPTTSLLVLDAPSLARRALVKLRGDFSFDAVSRGGSRLFLIQYLSPSDPTRYAVRSYDVGAMRLDPKQIVDPREPHEAMRGNPLSRAASPDGRWAYTLYDGGGVRPFIHALDTSTATARCIDVDGVAPMIVLRLRLRLADGGDTVWVRDAAKTLAVLDTHTLTVAAPAGGRSWRAPILGAAAALVLVAGAVLLLLRRRRRPLRTPVPVD